MKEQIQKMLEQTKDIHLPIPIDESEMNETRLAKKPVLETRLLDDMESLDHWVLIDTYSKTLPETMCDPNDLSDRAPILPKPTMELSAERCVGGSHSLKFTHPTNLPHMTEKAPGRIYAIPSVMRTFDREDWTAWNRLSAWIYPVAPGMKSITLRIQLHNDGVRKVPDIYERDGAHNMTLKGNEWNHIVLEIPYLDRECVTGVSFDYDMVGHEPDAVDHVTWYIDKLELQKVKADVYEGWIPGEGRISFSGSGYQPGSIKIAIAADCTSDHFKLIETKTGRVVLEKPIEKISGKIGDLLVMNFTEVMDEGEYIIVAGDMTTRAFSISNDVWESSIWKELNFFLALRCGHEVFGKHRKCHADHLIKHDGKAIVADGGWHDAGDLAQSFTNTSEATMALLSLAMSLKDTGNDRLFTRVLEEAKWGLDYVIKMRFGDGYRSTYTSCSIWTDGVIGTEDDIVTRASRSAYSNFDAAYAEALGAQLFEKIDPDYARYALKIAKEDFDFGVEIWEEFEKLDKNYDDPMMQFSIGDIVDPEVCSLGSMTAAELWKLTGEERYAERAVSFAEFVMASQQQELTDWDVPMVGFFYQDRKKDLIWHHNHMAHSQFPDLCLRTLCETFPDSPKYMEWYSALALSGEYYKAMAKFTFPYGLIPAGVYHKDEVKELGRKVIANHPMIFSDTLADDYATMTEKGFPLGNGYYLRVYPVWFSFRGDYNVLLSESKAISSGALVRNDYESYTISQNQYEWIVGKNPFAQSTMYGEGYDYVQLYAVQPGQTVGALSVGMESHFDTDEPYWPQVDTATYKEVWVCPATKWVWCMADNFLPAKVTGYIKVEPNAVLTFKHVKTGKTYTALPHCRTGFYEIELPAGQYEMNYGDMTRKLTVISGKTYELDGALYALDVTAAADKGKVTVTVYAKGEHDLPVEIKTDNLKGIDAKTVIVMKNGEGELTLTGEIINPKKPYVGIVIPNGNLGDKIEFLDERL